ncbi:MAG: Mrp/NBP35 family ATP-binding protein [Desulfovibrionaceae bacterium]
MNNTQQYHDLGQAITQKKEEDKLSNSLKNMKNKIVIMSGKGGVGKSSVSVNLAVQLSLLGKRVGLLDLDLHGPSVPALLKTKTAPKYVENGTVLLPAKYNDTLSILSVQYLLEDENSPIVWRGPKKHSAIQFFLKDVAWGELDYFIVDTPPGTGDEILTLSQTIDQLCAIIVTTPEEIALADVRKTIRFAYSSEIAILGLIENMSSLTCPHCSGEIDIFGKDGGRELSVIEQIPFLGAIPLDLAAKKAAEDQKALVEYSESSLAKESYIQISKKILDYTENLC